MERQNPCLTCGAGCAFYRVSFYWVEAGGTAGAAAPAEMTVQGRPLLAVMKGTDQPKPRYVALEGTIGGYTRCMIYQNRPSVRREFTISRQHGQPNELCDQARKGWGLPALPAPKSIRRRRPRTLRQV